jgi:hypothetical protein
MAAFSINRRLLGEARRCHKRRQTPRSLDSKSSLVAGSRACRRWKDPVTSRRATARTLVRRRQLEPQRAMRLEGGEMATPIRHQMASMTVPNQSEARLVCLGRHLSPCKPPCKGVVLCRAVLSLEAKTHNLPVVLGICLLLVVG